MNILNVDGDVNGFAPIAQTMISNGIEDGGTFTASTDASIAKAKGDDPAPINKLEI